MSKYLVEGTDMTSVANAIRTAGGTSAQLAFPSEFVTAIGNISGGGGSSIPAVMGTFTPAESEKGNAKTISLAYTGSGYPIALIIFPSVGINKANSDFATLAQKNVIIEYVRVKADTSATPTYSGSGNENKGSYIAFYKNSDSDPTQTSQNVGLDGTMFTSSAAGTSAGTIVRFNSSTALSVLVANTSYGFKDGIEYTYLVLYSA